MAEETLITLATTILAAIYALYQRYQNKQVIDYFTPDTNVTVAPKQVPKRSFMMSDSVRDFLTGGESLEDQEYMSRQIDDAENAGLEKYRVYFSKGYYVIEWGQISGGKHIDARDYDGQ